MRLSKSQKDSLAKDLLRAATKKKGLELAASVKKVEELWREALKDHFRGAVPEIPEARWADLLQDGVLLSAGKHGAINFRTLDKDGDGGTSVNSFMAEDVGTSIASALSTVRILQDHFTGVPVNLYQTGVRGYRCTIHIRASDIPGMSLVSEVDLTGRPASVLSKHWTALTSALITPTMKLAEMGLTMLQEGEAYLLDVEQALRAVSTRAQLIELFPEAEQYLDPRPEKKSNIVPASLFENARRRLAEGIPD